MGEVNYKEKIRNLLALAESPNEHEAKAALLKARELMAKYKLTERDVQDAKKQDVKRVMTDITCSKRRNPWITELSCVISENYCCKGFRSHMKGKQTHAIGFIGLEDDVEICVAVFKYAVNSIISEVTKIRTEYRYICSTDYAVNLGNSYGYGFIRGLIAAFQKQKEENEAGWGLVLVTLREVEEEAERTLGHAKFRPKAAETIHKSAYQQGYDDGKKFDLAKRIAAEA